MAIEVIDDVGIGRPASQEWMANFRGSLNVLVPGLEFRPFTNVGLIYVTATELIEDDFEEPTPDEVHDAVSELMDSGELGSMANRQIGTALSGEVKHRRVNNGELGMLRIAFHDWKDNQYPEGLMIHGEINAIRREWEMDPKPARESGKLEKYAIHIGEVIGNQNLLTKKVMTKFSDRINRHIAFDPISTVRSPVIVTKEYE